MSLRQLGEAFLLEFLQKLGWRRSLSGQKRHQAPVELRYIEQQKHLGIVVAPLEKLPEKDRFL